MLCTYQSSIHQDSTTGIKESVGLKIEIHEIHQNLLNPMCIINKNLPSAKNPLVWSKNYLNPAMGKKRECGMREWQRIKSRLRPIPVLGISIADTAPDTKPIPAGRHCFVSKANAVCWLFTGSRKRSNIDGRVGGTRRHKGSTEGHLSLYIEAAVWPLPLSSPRPSDDRR